jgi:hypothetical protein
MRREIGRREVALAKIRGAKGAADLLNFTMPALIDEVGSLVAKLRSSNG